MQVFDYNLQNKGAATADSINEVNQPHVFTYFYADERSTNLHICCQQDEDNWLTQRDNGTTVNVDAAIIARLTTFVSKPRA